MIQRKVKLKNYNTFTTGKFICKYLWWRPSVPAYPYMIIIDHLSDLLLHLYCETKLHEYSMLRWKTKAKKLWRSKNWTLVISLLKFQSTNFWEISSKLPSERVFLKEKPNLQNVFEKRIFCLAQCLLWEKPCLWFNILLRRFGCLDHFQG